MPLVAVPVKYPKTSNLPFLEFHPSLMTAHAPDDPQIIQMIKSLEPLKSPAIIWKNWDMMQSTGVSTCLWMM